MNTPFRILLACLALAVAAPGPACVDPAGKLDEFYEASEPFRLTVVTAPCSERVDISGEYLLSIAAVVKPAAPILFAATVTVDDTVEPWGINIAMTPLAVADRGLVGDPLEASGTVNEDGTFSVDFGSVAVLGAANAIIPGSTSRPSLCSRAAPMARDSAAAPWTGRSPRPRRWLWSGRPTGPSA